MSVEASGLTADQQRLISEATEALQGKVAGRWPVTERFKQNRAAANITAVILGSGLAALADKIESPIVVSFDDIPGFGRSTASGHRGQLILGHLGGAAVIAMAGRLHRYEGWSCAQVAFPVAVMHSMGAGRLVASNAAGGINPKLAVGDIVVIRDHIDWLHQRIAGQRVSVFSGMQFSSQQQSMHAQGWPPVRTGLLYDDRLAAVALAAAREGGFTAVEGTYLATLGPTYETRAEYRMMRRIGADVVGMSTVPEVMMARRCGMDVLALSIVSNVADPDRAIVADHGEVLEAGDAAAGKLEQIVCRVI